jgi:hypothetical protein
MRQRCCYALAASAHQRRKLIAQLHHLQNHSFESPDFREQDTTGRWLNVKVLRPFLITYWLDGSVNELRIVDVQHPR